MRLPSRLVAFPVVAGLLLILLTMVEGKKELANYPVLRDAVPHVQCPVCKLLVSEAINATATLREGKKGKKLTENDVVEEVLDLICHPRSKQGQWIRKLDLVYRPGQTDGNVGPTLVVEQQDVLGTCRRECMTLADACTTVLDSDSADQLSPMLFKGKSLESITSSVCGSHWCSRKNLQRLNQKFPLTVDDRRTKYDVEDHEEIESKELEIEQMMDDMDRKKGNGQPGYDVFSRDEMLGLQDAMRSGDYNKFQELDPDAGELSEEDFAALREMQRSEESGGSEQEELGTERDAASSSQSGSNSQSKSPTTTSQSWWNSFTEWIGFA
jgi:hypothetical protein